MKVLVQLILLSAVSVLVMNQIQPDCETTHLQYFTDYYLGKQDQLNKTFIKIQQKITLDDVTFKRNDTATYTIKGIKPKFFYIDTRQKAQIVGNNTVVITGGRVDVRFDFQWMKSGGATLTGTGSANALSDIISFSYQYRPQKGFLLQILTDADEVAFNEYGGIQLTRISPPETSQDDANNIKLLLNNIMNVTTVRLQLQAQIDKYFRYYLNQSLYDDRRIIDQHFQYEWVGSKGKLIIPFEMTATSFDVEKDGVTLKYKARIKDYTEWKCEDSAPSMHWNPNVYGGIQQFFTFDVFRNSLRYAIDLGHLDADLDRAGWQSRFFQFFAGDLYEVIPYVQKKFLARQVVTGSCKTSSRNLNFIKGGWDFYNVTMMYNCDLGVLRDKVADFQINITFAVQGRPNNTHLNFYVINQTHNAVLIPYLDYKIENPVLAQHMITHSLYRLWGHRVFGSGWKLYDRDYPHFVLDDKNHTVIYDSTHVDPHLSQQQKQQLNKLFQQKHKIIKQKIVKQVQELNQI